MSRSALSILALALVAGAWLRFANLGSLQMSADEGASWASASASSASAVIVSQQIHNPGKLPMHDLILHYWIAIFGGGIAAMRSLSALIGTLGILLMVSATREMLRSDAGLGPPTLDERAIDQVAVIAALICAVSMITIKYSREMRMYPLVFDLSLAQVWGYFGAIRRPGPSRWVLLGVLSAALMAAHPITVLLIGIEGLWLLIILASSPHEARPWRIFLGTGISLVGGLILIAPAFLAMRRVLSGLVAERLTWIEMPPWWEPVALFNKASGSIAFIPLVALAAWAVWRGWSRDRGAIGFAVLWMLAPPILLVAGSHLYHPMYVERYVLYCFPAFFILIAMGVWQLRSTRLRVAGAIVAVGFAMGHVYSYSLKNHDSDWRGAAQFAASRSAPDRTVSVVPSYAVEVVRYYAPATKRGGFISFDEDHLKSPMVIVGSIPKQAKQRIELDHTYPTVVFQSRGLVVRSR